MAKLRYEISPVAGGWQVSCNGIPGPPYATRDAAVRDTLAVAENFQRDGQPTEVRLFDMDGIGQILEPRDARLFSE
ncbi:MAG TPA: hypothetical protein VFE52_00970 [Devosia sp.]|nr:hypothetical protein [Devosia sp.]